jgi:type I site-specific restriction-modification system R (restriction) subunit
VFGKKQRGNIVSFLGAFAKLRKATNSFAMSASLSIRMEQLDSHWTDFHEI